MDFYVKWKALREILRQCVYVQQYIMYFPEEPPITRSLSSFTLKLYLIMCTQRDFAPL